MNETPLVGHDNNGGGRYVHIDAMRAFAVFLVVVAHAGLGHIVPGGSGVTIFFTISGFIITHLVLKEQMRTNGFDLSGFYLRRLMKLAPSFMVIIAIPTFIYSYWYPINWVHFLTQVFFVFNWMKMTGTAAIILPGTGVVWSLAIEEQFYIVFSLLWLVVVKTTRYRLFWLVGGALVVAASSLFIRIYIAVTDFSHERIYYGTDTRMEGIAIGILAAVLYFILMNEASRLRRILANDGIVFVSLGLYVFSLIYRDEFFRETFRYTIQAVSTALMILYGMLQNESAFRKRLHQVLKIRLIQVIGLASYSIYLVHYPLVYLLQGVVAGWPKMIAVAFLVLVGLSVGVMIWFVVERPVERLKKHITNRKTKTA